VNTENTHFWLVDDWRCTKASKAAEAGDRKGGASQVFNTCFSITGCAGDAAHFCGGLPNVHCFNVLDNRDKQSTVRLGSDAEVDCFVASHDIGFIVVQCVALWAFSECLDKRLHDEGQVGEFWCSFGPSCVEVLSKFFQSGDIHFFKVREMRDG